LEGQITIVEEDPSHERMRLTLKAKGRLGKPGSREFCFVSGDLPE
jgi:hypothetical protein